MNLSIHPWPPEDITMEFFWFLPLPDVLHALWRPAQNEEKQVQSAVSPERQSCP